MNDEIAEILEGAMMKEVAASAMYLQAAAATTDSAAVSLLKGLAAEEDEHLRLLKSFDLSKMAASRLGAARIPDLKLSKHLTAPDELPGADLIGSLLFAMKREAESVDFYIGLMSVFMDANAKKLCQALARQELAHKLHLELLYDRIAMSED